MTAKLNQIIAIEKGIKAKTHSDLSEVYKAIQKPELFNGFSKEYRPKYEDDEGLPPEKKRVQFAADDVMRTVERTMTELLTVTARKDWTNCRAKADVIVDGATLFSKVPISYLLFLEKQLTDLRTLFSTLPILDEGENWNKDINSGLYKSDIVQTHRTKKVSKPLVLYPATPEHPAQTQMVTEDIIAGFWERVEHSGAIPKPEREKLFNRADKVLRAVKEARERANLEDEVVPPDIGNLLFEFLLKE